MTQASTAATYAALSLVLLSPCLQDLNCLAYPQAFLGNSRIPLGAALLSFPVSGGAVRLFWPH
jgi:hypothetical protein